MNFTFLGTSSGVPTRRRNVSGLALRPGRGKPWYLIDCGEGTQHQLQRASGFSLHHLAAVLITHMHGDHCFGLPGLLASAGMRKRETALTLIGPAELREFVDCALRLSASYLPFPIEFIDVKALGTWEGPGAIVDAWPLSHRLPCWAYRFSETRIERKLDKDALLSAGIEPGPCWGQLLRGEAVLGDDGRALPRENFLLPARAPRRIVVAGDNDRPELLGEACRDAQVLIHEATYKRADFERLGAGRQHSHAAQVGQFAQQIGINNLVLTHFSPRYTNVPDARDGINTLGDEAAAHYQGRLFLAEDLARYQLAPGGELTRLSDAPTKKQKTK